MNIVRTFSRAGPCITEGKLIKTTAKFYVFEEWRGGETYSGRKKIFCSKAHIEPCPSCADHPKTQYPNGYMD
jgi:hypothetical protein